MITFKINDQVTFNSTSKDYKGIKGAVIEIIDVPEVRQHGVGHHQWVRVKTNKGFYCDGLYSGLYFIPEQFLK